MPARHRHVPYMAPEQLRGEKADARTDIFAFGAVLYEMLTGTGRSQADPGGTDRRDPGATSPRSVSDAPAADTSRPRIGIVQKCLAKDPDDRWQTARDLKSELIWVRDGTRGYPARSNPRKRAPTRLAFVADSSSQWLFRRSQRWRSPSSSGVHVRISPSARARSLVSRSICRRDHPPHPNQRHFGGYRSRRKPHRLHRRPRRRDLALHTYARHRRHDAGAGYTEAVIPMFSADSQWVAFGVVGAIKKVPAGGGPVQVMTAGGGGPMTWLGDGRVVARFRERRGY